MTPAPHNPTSMEPLIAFLDGGGFANAVRTCGFSQQELITRIINHVRDPDPTVSQKGIAQFRTLLHDTLSANGKLVRQTITETEGPDGQISQVSSISLTRLPPSLPIPDPDSAHFSLPPLGESLALPAPDHEDPSTRSHDVDAADAPEDDGASL